MKYLLLVGVLVVVYLLWRSQRAAGGGRPVGSTQPPPAALPQDMVRCAVCAVHLPQVDALPGPDGRLYCSAEHRPAPPDAD